MYTVGVIVTLSLSDCNEEVAKTLPIYYKVKAIPAPHYYIIFSPHGLIQGSHCSSLLSSLYHET